VTLSWHCGYRTKGSVWGCVRGKFYRGGFFMREVYGKDVRGECRGEISRGWYFTGRGNFSSL